MAIATSYGAFIAGEWVHGEGGSEIEVRSPYDDALIGAVTPASEAQVDAAVAAAKAAFPAWRRTPLRDARGAVPPRVRPLHGAQRGDRGDDRPRGRQDHPRGARGDGGVHRRPLPAGLRGRAAVRRQRAAVDAGGGRHEADHGGAGADRRGRGHLAVELPGRHRRHPARVRARARLHDGVEAVGVRAASAPTCSCSCCTTRASRPAPSTSCTAAARWARSWSSTATSAPSCSPGSVETGEQRGARRRPQEPRARAGRQRPADRVRRRRHRQGRRRRDHGLLLPRRAVLHGGGAHPRALVGEGSVRRGAASRGRRS